MTHIEEFKENHARLVKEKIILQARVQALPPYAFLKKHKLKKELDGVIKKMYANRDEMLRYYVSDAWREIGEVAVRDFFSLMKNLVRR